jgi:hypothetical protein
MAFFTGGQYTRPYTSRFEPVTSHFIQPLGYDSFWKKKLCKNR